MRAFLLGLREPDATFDDDGVAREKMYRSVAGTGNAMAFGLWQRRRVGAAPYRLAPTGRFCHRAAYVQATLAAAGLVDTGMDAIVARQECGEPVNGPLVTSRATARA